MPFRHCLPKNRTNSCPLTHHHDSVRAQRSAFSSVTLIDMADKNPQKPQESKGFRRNARKFFRIEPRSTSQGTSSFRKIFGRRSGSPASSNSGLLTSKSSTENQGRALTCVEEEIKSVPMVAAVHQQGMFVDLGRISAESLYNWPVHETPTRSVSSMSKEISSE